MTLELHNSDVSNALLAAGVPDRALFLGDTFYALPTERWITGPFSESFTRVLSGMGIKYTEESHDCENFAQLCAWFAAHCHAETPGSPTSGLAFGELWVASLSHAINFAVHRDDAGSLYVKCYEPQIGARGFSCRPFDMQSSDYRSVILCKA